MSKPENRLAQFQSYSAMHILVMCDGMATADALQKNPNVFVDTSLPTGEVQAISNPLDASTTGKYIILYDGRSTSKYSIDSVHWETVLSPLGDNGNNFDTIETDGEMVIEEPLGVEFLELLVTGTAELGVDPSGVVFMLKTFFVGFDANGEQQTVDDILPFTFIMIDLTASMEASGTKYKITLFGTSNGVAKLPQIANIANGITIPFEVGMTLKDAFNALQAKVREAYDKHKALVIATLEKQIATGETSLTGRSASELIEERYSRVNYTFTLDEKYQNDKYKVGTDEGDVIFKNGSQYSIKFPPDCTVEQCISGIMKSCPQVVSEATVKRTSQDITEINTSALPKITSRLMPTGTDGAYAIQYKVYRMIRQHQPLGEKLNPGVGEVLEFDYIYTGKNTDILDFDIKLDMGLAFFNTPVAAKSATSTQTETNKSRISPLHVTTDASGIQKLDANLGNDKVSPARKSPLFLGATVKPTSFNDRTKPAATYAFDQALATQAALESIQGKVKIVGNPQFLNEILAEDTENVENTSDNTAMLHKYQRPGLCKINIKFPADSELNSVKQFWYNGYYSIYSVENDFEGGVFTQTLHLFSLQVASSLPDDMVNAQPVEVESLPDFVEESVDPDEPPREISFGVLGRNDTGNNDPDRKRDWPDADIFRKRSALLARLGPEMVQLYPVIVDVWKLVTGNIDPVITSGHEGESGDKVHSTNSRHYRGLAIDIRGKDLYPGGTTDQLKARGNLIKQQLEARLSRDYDVIWETHSPHVYNWHIHIEYDPKSKKVGHEPHGADL